MFGVPARRRPSGWLLVPLALVTLALVHGSGIHATIAGVAVGLVIPAISPGTLGVPRARGATEHATGTNTGAENDLEAAATVGPAARMEHAFKPWSSCVAVPLFAFFADGDTGGGLSGLVDSVTTPVSLGIIAGLAVGKTVGITGATYLITRLPGVRLDPTLRWPDLLGVSMPAGIGFTFSLLVGDLAFGQVSALDDDAKVGVLIGSTIAALAGLTLLAARARGYRDAPHEHEPEVG